MASGPSFDALVRAWKLIIEQAAKREEEQADSAEQEAKQ